MTGRRRTILGRPHRQRGLSMIELILSTAGLAMVGLALSSMLFATRYGTESSRDIRSLVVKHKTVLARFGAAVRSSKMVLAQGSGYVVLWMEDTDESGTPHLAELRRIERDLVTNELRSYRAPDDLPAGDNTEYDLASTDFNDVTTLVKGTADFPAALWADDVNDLAITLDDADPQAARLVKYRITFVAGDLTDTVVNATSPRGQ